LFFWEWVNFFFFVRMAGTWSPLFLLGWLLFFFPEKSLVARTSSAQVQALALSLYSPPSLPLVTI
jgi:hypothetical protein